SHSDSEPWVKRNHASPTPGSPRLPEWTPTGRPNPHGRTAQNRDPAPPSAARRESASSPKPPLAIPPRNDVTTASPRPTTAQSPSRHPQPPGPFRSSLSAPAAASLRRLHKPAATAPPPRE